MANLVLTKFGEFFEVIDADRGVAVFSATNQSVAQNFINNGVVDPETVRRFAQQDINYQGGVDTSPSPVSPAQNSQIPAVPPGQVRVFDDSNTTTTITPTTTRISEGQVRVFGDTTTTDIVPTTTRISEGQVRVFDNEVSNTTGSPTPAAAPEFVENSTGLNVLPADIPVQRQGNELVDLNTGQVVATDPDGFITSSTGLNVLPEDVPNEDLNLENPEPILLTEANTGPAGLTPAQLDAIARAQGVDAGDTDIEVGTTEAQLYDQENQARVSALRDQARQQQTISQQRKQVNNGDWRVRLRLAPQAKYLYNAPNPGILQPLKISDGVIFPYTPSIQTAYRAQYSDYALTHSNYKGYFYQGSFVDAINLNCTFTAQGTSEANYLLAVITFFKSVTKMFYGQDAERGAPPPLVYLSGLGEYQFNEHACLVSQFNYSLPADVDYIRAGSNNIPGGMNLTTQRDRQGVATASNFGSLNRLASALLTKGALSNPFAPPSLGLNSPTYVPTKMEIQLTLLPVQSRNQVSRQFSVKEFANGNLIKGGFW